MYGNLVNNQRLLELRQRGLIQITPFEESLLRTVHYPLHPKAIYNIESDGVFTLIHSFEEMGSPFFLNENQYVLVETRERIEVDKGIVGQFIPASNLIEQGLGLTAGRIEYPFGKNGEGLRFGLKNLLGRVNRVTAEQYLAYVQFFDLRGLASRAFTLNQRDLKVLGDRVEEVKRSRAQDDGVFYEEPDYEIQRAEENVDADESFPR